MQDRLDPHTRENLEMHARLEDEALIAIASVAKKFVRDPEAATSECEGIICNVLGDLGMHRLVLAWRAVERW